jgi:hypothetical protein
MFWIKFCLTGESSLQLSSGTLLIVWPITRVDYRTRRDHVQVRMAAWKQQMPRLIATYLAWKAEGAPPAGTFPNEPCWEIVTVNIFHAFSLVLTNFQC